MSPISVEVMMIETKSKTKEKAGRHFAAATGSIHEKNNASLLVNNK